MNIKKIKLENFLSHKNTESDIIIGNWGRYPVELRESARQTGDPVISYDDILDTLLAVGKGI